jgi:hypothetical protein
MRTPAVADNAWYSSSPWAWDWNGEIEQNRTNVDADYSESEHRSTGILRNSINRQDTYGLISKLNFKVSDDDFEFSDDSDSPNKRLENGVAGKANNDGTIEIDPNLSPVEREKTIVHEEKHMKDMESGKLAYDDDYVTWNGKKYERKDGNIIYKGKALIEGDPSLPWEKVAYAAEPSTSAVKRKLY